MSLFIFRTQRRKWPSTVTPRQRYLLEKAYARHRWRIEERRTNRFSARVVQEGAFDDSAAADGDISDDDDANGEHRDAEDGGEDEGGADDGGENGGAAPIGRAADGVDDGDMETVLLVQARTRSPQHLTRAGAFDAIAKWYEIVPRSRMAAVLRSVSHAGGTLYTTEVTLYRRLAESYIGIAHSDVAMFMSRAETATLSRSNAAADAIIAPAMPTRLGQRWAADLTFSDGTLPLAPYVGFMTVIDALSRFAWLQPIADKSAATVAGMLESLFEAEGPPEVLQLDNALEHKSASVRLVCQRHGVALRFTRPYRSEENGQVEVCHKTIKQLLRKMVLDTRGQPIDAAAMLAAAARMYNASPNAVTQMSPFLLWRGRPPATLQAPILLTAAEAEDDGDEGRASTQRHGHMPSRGRRPSVGSVSTSRGVGGVRRELREILADQSARDESNRQAARLRQQNTAAAAAAAVRPTASVGSKTAREQWRTAPAAAVASRLGLLQSRASDREAASRLAHQRAAASSSSAAAAAIPAASLTGNTGEWKIGRVLAVVHDAVTNQLLYGVRWAPPFDDVARDVFVPAAWIGGATDAQMTAFIKRTQHDALPIVFSRSFRGPAALDRKRAIPLSIVLSDVEAGDDGGDGGGGGAIGNAMRDADTAGAERVTTLMPSTAAAATSQQDRSAGFPPSRLAPQLSQENSNSSSNARAPPRPQGQMPQAAQSMWYAPMYAAPTYATAPQLTPAQLQQQVYARHMQQLLLQQQRHQVWGMPPQQQSVQHPWAAMFGPPPARR